MSNRETAREAPNPRAQLPRRNYGNWSAALASFARCKPRHCTNQRLATRSSRAAHSPWARPTRWAFKALGSPTHNEDVRASTMLPSLLQHQSHAQTRVPQAAARDCHVLRGLPPRALVPELGDNGDCVLHEGYRCVLAQRRRPHSAGCRRHRLLRRWARDGAGMDIGQALLRIPTVETGGKMLFGRALSRLRRPTVRNAGAWRQPHRISSTSKSSSFGDKTAARCCEEGYRLEGSSRRTCICLFCRRSFLNACPTSASAAFVFAAACATPVGRPVLQAHLSGTLIPAMNHP